MRYSVESDDLHVLRDTDLQNFQITYDNARKMIRTAEDPVEVELCSVSVRRQKISERIKSVIIIQPEAFGGNMIRLTEILETDSPLIRFASDRGSCPYEQKFFAAELYEHFACKDPASEIIR